MLSTVKCHLETSSFATLSRHQIFYLGNARGDDVFEWHLTVPMMENFYLDSAR